MQEIKETKAQEQDLGSAALNLISKYMEVKELERLSNQAIKYRVVKVYGDLVPTFKQLYRDLTRVGLAPAVRREKDGTLTLIVTKYSMGSNLATVIGLAVVTLITVYVSGLEFVSSPGGNLVTPLLYLVGLLGPLLIHEGGHWIFMRRFNVPRSLPYLIPAPPLQLGFLGTLGAVINMKWIPATSDELALIGVAGPLAGFVAAIPVAIIGLHMSVLVPAAAVPPSSTLPAVPVIMYLLLASLHTPSGYVVEMSPLSFAAYIVFFVTFLNLMPVGQLDGGHVIRAALGERGHLIVSIIFVILLFIAGAYIPTLGLFGIIALFLLLITRWRHPGPAVETSKISTAGVVAIIIYGILLALTVPMP